MGLDINGTRFLLYGHNQGVDFTRTAMIGRQGLHLRPRDLKRVFHAHGHPVREDWVEALFARKEGYAEPFLECLGSKDIHSYDHSNYEHSTHVHDMNLAVPDSAKGRYSVVLDGGSLEHVFNFPRAIRNCMEMLAVGGHFLAITPANNYAGHGLYQFSPELFFSVFTPGNGFGEVKVIAIENTPWARWHAVTNPRDVGRRVTLIHRNPVCLMVMARKLADARLFETIPQQSDYVIAWGGRGVTPDAQKASFLSRVKRRVPESAKGKVFRFLRHFRSGFDPRFFVRMDPLAEGASPPKPLHFPQN